MTEQFPGATRLASESNILEAYFKGHGHFRTFPRVAISGRLACGKTEAAKALVEDMGFTKTALADELKSIAGDIADWMYEHGYRSWPLGEGSVLDLKNKTTINGRAFLQWLGTECLRRRLPDIWVQMLVRKITSGPTPVDRIVVDDVRFFNEVDGLRAADFIMVRIETPEEIRRERVARLYPQYRDNPSVFAHVSEIQLDDYKDWDAIFDGSLPVIQFRKQIVDWAARTFALPLSQDVTNV